MSSIDEIRGLRIKKLEILKEKGMEPYPADSKRELSLADALQGFSEFEKSKEEKWISGRIMSIRGQGAIIFITLYDGTAQFQGLLKRDVIGEEKLNFWNEVVDIGDFVEIQGIFFTTKRGEKTLETKDWRMLSKSLRPLPEKWHGLVDVDERFRKRYLDILMNPELKEIFEKKEKFWDATREFMKAGGFLEVETPTIEITTGGAEARPFKTHHNDFDIDVYMRISVGELWMKRLLSAGFPKVFEIGRVYRNEGSSPEHTQEFTNMEFYTAFMNLDEGKKFVRDLYITTAKEVFGQTKFTTREYTFDVESEWGEIDYAEEIKKRTGIDIFTATPEIMTKKLEELGVSYEGKNLERLTDSLWKYCRKQITGPVFLVNHPKLVAPLSKTNPKDSRKTEMFQVIMAGSEMGRAHAELNDPIDQMERFTNQQSLVTGGDEEAMMADHDFVEMLEYGMPPCFGFGFGERYFSFLIDKPIREVQLFPLMKPKENESVEKNKKETMIAVAVLNTGAGLEKWQELNTVAHLNAAFGARVGKKELFTKDVVISKDNQQIKLNIKNAIIIKSASSSKEIQKLTTEAKEASLEVDEFIREMIETTNDKKITEITASKNLKDIEHLGVLVYGSKTIVEKLTSNLKLY